MKYSTRADILWYSGHVITGIGIVTPHYHFFWGITFVFVGQCFTMISRPMGRMRDSIPENVTLVKPKSTFSEDDDRPTRITI
jgi:hypothetical protein